MLSNFESLWTSEAESHVLIRVESESGVAEYVIYDMEDETVLVIEDDAVHQEVIQRMKKAGVKILHGLPRENSCP